MTIKKTKDSYKTSEKDFIDFIESHLKNIDGTIATIKQLKLNITISNIFRLDLILPYLYFKYYRLSKLEKSRYEISSMIKQLKGMK